MTSGGDAPGMNAVVRAVARTADGTGFGRITEVVTDDEGEEDYEHEGQLVTGPEDEEDTRHLEDLKSREDWEDDSYTSGSGYRAGGSTSSKTRRLSRVTGPP